MPRPRAGGVIQSHGEFVATAIYTYTAAKTAHAARQNAIIHGHCRNGFVVTK
jgi:hypothetical protein